MPLSNANAACGNSQRIGYIHAECLDAEIWTDSGNWWFDEIHHYKARNRCSDLGAVVVKIDIPVWPDETWTIPYGDDDWHEGYTDKAQPQNIHCCTDLSDLCERSDLVNEQGCRDRWAESAASAQCVQESFNAHPADSRCEIGAKCQRDDGSLRPTSAHVHYHHVYRLTVCDGHLRQGC